MKLQELHIENFGVFSACQRHFGPGFQLLYGENEAGKTTLLQLIRELLFGGFPHQSGYALDRRQGEMAASALIELADGTRLRFRRRKGRKDKFAGRNETTGQPIDESELSQMLGSASAELYHNVFAFRLEELSEGEDSLTRANLSEALYGSGVGGLASVQRVQKTLSDERQRLYVPRGKNPLINRQLRAAGEIESELRRTVVKPRDFELLAKTCAEREAHVQQLQESLENLRREEAHGHRLSDALPLWLQRADSERELAELDVPADFPPHAADEYRRCRESVERLDAECLEVAAELGMNADTLGTMVLAPEVVAREAEIKHLQQQIGKIQGFRNDLPLRRQDASTIRAGVLDKLKHLSPEWGLEQLETFQSSLAQRETFESLRAQWDELQRRKSELQAQRPALLTDVSTGRKRLEELKQVEAAPLLEDLVDRQASYQSDQDKLAELIQRRQHVSAEIHTLRTKLDSPLGRTVTNAEKLPVPMETTVVEFGERFRSIEKTIQRHEHGVETAQAELANRRQMLVQLEAEEQIPSREAMLGQRARRDEGWQLIRQKYVVGKPDSDRIRRWLADADEPLADIYEREVRRADSLADQLQSNAELVARREQLLVEIDHAAHQVAEAELRLQQSEAERTELREEWEALWASCRFPPLSPEAMQRWLTLHGELLEKLEEDSVLEIQQRDIEARIGDFEDELQEALPDVPESPHRRLAEARRRVEVARHAAAQRQTYETELPRKVEQLERLGHELEEGTKRLDAWTEQWRTTLTEAQFPADWDVNVATKILSGIGEARQEFSQALAHEQRAADMEKQLAEFDEHVKNLCSEIANDLADHPAEDAALQLNQRLEAARQAQRDREGLLEAKANLEKRLASKQSQRQPPQERLDQLMQAAGAEDASHFHAIAAAAARKHELQSQTESLSQQINTIRGTEDKATFLAALAEADADSLAARLRQLAEQIHAADAEYRSASESLGIHRDRLRKLDGTSEAIRLQADLESTRSELVSAVDRWAPMVLAEALLKQAIARFESEHQPEMLEEVKRLFGRMTRGRYVDIRRRLDGPLQVEEHDGTLKEPPELSRGTREQLYLAIRLAYVHHYGRNAEPLPLAMDDVLVNFDDQRALETLEVLWEIAESWQIIFLTCHQSIVDLVTSARPDVEPIHLHSGAMLSSS